MAKKQVGSLKLQVPAGQAKPAPPVGPALGQRGLNIMEFCKTFNAKTQGMEPGMPCPTIITYFQDKSFSIEIKTPACVPLSQAGCELGVGIEDPRARDRGLRDHRTAA